MEKGFLFDRVNKLLTSPEKNEDVIKELCKQINNYNKKNHDPGLFCAEYYNKINSTDYDSEDIWERRIKDYLIGLRLINKKKAEKEDDKQDAGAIARNLFRLGANKLYNCELMEYTRMIYYVCAALNLTFEDTSKVCSDVFFKRPFYVRCSVLRLFQTP